MVNELNALESKIAQVAALCRQLREDNAGLQEKLDAAESEKQRLTERMDAARARLEQLALQLPEAKVKVKA
jgi:cell division protein ZapB